MPASKPKNPAAERFWAIVFILLILLSFWIKLTSHNPATQCAGEDDYASCMDDATKSGR